jgi:hypothetical protein
MDATPARIRLSIREGLIEVEGSEEFVAKHIEELKGLLAAAPVSKALTPPVSATGPKSSGTESVVAPMIPDAHLSNYENVFTVPRRF